MNGIYGNSIIVMLKREVKDMDTKRAQEIAASPIMANVTCNGANIYIERVDEQNATALVHPLNEPSNKQNVSVANLEEH